MVKSISKEDKEEIEKVLKDRGLMLPVQGAITLNISPDQKVSSIGVNVTLR